MNFRALAENLDMEEGEFLEMMGLFLKTSISNLSQLQAAIDQGDGQKAMIAMHSIKGAALNLGLMEIYEVARKTEMEARENNLNEVAMATRVIREKLDRIAESLVEYSKLKVHSEKVKQ